MRRSWSATCCCLALGVAAVLSACTTGTSVGRESSADSTVLARGGTMTAALSSPPENFNPSTNAGNSADVKSVTVNLFPAAFHTLPDFTVQRNADLLDGVEVTDRSPQTVVYRIRPHARWSDGVPITAADFAYAWANQNGTQDVDVASTTGYEDIAAVRGSNGGRTVTVVFRRPFSDWRSLFSDLLPAHLMRRLPGGWDGGLRTMVPVTGGPFVMTDHEPGDHVVLARNPSYYGSPARLDRLVYRVLPDASSQVDALRNGEVQLIYPGPQRETLAQVRRAGSVRADVGLGATYEHLDFNLRHPLLRDVQVRRAFALALDRQRLLESLIRPVAPQAQVLGNRLYTATQADYEDHSGRYASRDVAGARRLLEGAGFAPGPDKIYARDGRRLSLALLIVAGNALREDQAVLMQSQLREAGIELRIETAGEDFGSRLGEGRFDVVSFAWTGTAFPLSGYESVFTTGADSNFGGFSDPRVDELFARALAEIDQRRAVELAHEIDRILWAELPTVPLYQRPSLLAYDARYGGIRDNTSADGPFAHAAEWGRRGSG